MWNGDGRGEAGVKESREVKPSPVFVCGSARLVGLLRYFKMVVLSPRIFLYYSLLSSKGEEVKAEKRKTADARTREEWAYFTLHFMGEWGRAKTKKRALPRMGVPVGKIGKRITRNVMLCRFRRSVRRPTF